MARNEWATRAAAVAAMASGLALAGTGIAVADNITDDIADGGTSLTLEAGSTASAVGKIKVVSTNGDGDTQCNIDPGDAPLRLDILTPTGITADVDPLAVTACDVFYSIRFTAAANAVSGSVRVAILSTPAGGGTFNNNVDIPIRVTQPVPQNTAPQVAVTGVTDGSVHRAGDVPAPGCSVVDAEDSDEAATPSISNGAYDAIGEHTATCSYTDGGGLTSSASAAYTVLRAVDTSAPVIGAVLPAADGSAGWHRGDVTLDWSVTEDESPETLQTSGCDDVTVTEDQDSTVYTCSASSEGGTATRSVSIKRDGTAPTVTAGAVVAGTEGLAGWYTSDVTVRFHATDATSGVSPAAQDVQSTGEGASVTVGSPAFTDNAGNRADAGTVSSAALKIDKQGPTGVELQGLPGSAVHFGNAPSPDAVTCTATDAVSGLASCAVTGVRSTVGTHTVTATATDVAGNRSTTSATYTVLPWETKGFYAPVDMTPASSTGPLYNTVKGGSTVPMKFELFAGSTELSSTSSVESFTAAKVSCVSGAGEDAIEQLASTGGTSLRYDATGGQFIQNWKVPAGAGVCYRTTLTATDGSVIRAFFKVK